jgi:hypothetical protein
VIIRMTEDHPRFDGDTLALDISKNSFRAVGERGTRIRDSRSDS